jgi:F-type H+-transporting ATPase subunit delta
MAHGISQHSVDETVFDVDVEKLARVYAQAGLDAAGDRQAQQGLVDELKQIESEVLVKNPGLEKLFASALVSHDDKLGIIDRVFGTILSEKALNFLKVIGRHGRLEILRPIIHNVGKLWMRRQNQLAVTLELAHEIDPSLQKEMIELIDKRLTADTIVTVKINPDLIAGFVVRAGDKVLDASVRTNLERARQTMVEKAVEIIAQRPDKYYQPTGA